MKKLLLLLLIPCLLLCSCNAFGGESNEETTIEIEALGVTIKNVSSTQIPDENGDLQTISIGFPSDDFDSLFPLTQGLVRVDFLKDASGNDVMIEFETENRELKIKSIQVFSPRERELTKADVEQIKKGMTVSEVVYLLGVPHYAWAGGIMQSYYVLEDGTTRYSITWERRMIDGIQKTVVVSGDIEED